MIDTGGEREQIMTFRWFVRSKRLIRKRISSSYQMRLVKHKEMGETEVSPGWIVVLLVQLGL